MEMPQIVLSKPDPTEEMDRLVRSFVKSKSYLGRHFLMRRIASLPGKEDIEINGPPLLIARWYIAVFKFTFQHGMRSPDCNCMDG